jgi:hypothetical protein
MFYKLLGEIWLLLFFLGSIKYLIIERFSKLYVLFILILVFVAGFIPVFDVYGISRHLFVLLPFAFIISSKFLIDLTGASKGSNILVLSFTLLLLTQAPIRNMTTAPNIATPRVQDKWAIWAANNLGGRIVIVEGSDLVEMSLINGRIGSKNLLNLSVEQLGMDPFRPNMYDSLEDAIKDFEKTQVRYVMLDKINISRFPYLYEVYKPEWSRHFILVRSFRSGPGDKWEIKDMDIFKIVY